MRPLHLGILLGDCNSQWCPLVMPMCDIPKEKLFNIYQYEAQWTLLDIITVNVLIWLMWSIFLRSQKPVFFQSGNERVCTVNVLIQLI